MGQFDHQHSFIDFPPAYHHHLSPVPAGAHTKGSINVRVAPIQLTDNPILSYDDARTERPDLHLPAAPRHPRDVRLQLHDQVGEGEGDRVAVMVMVQRGLSPGDHRGGGPRQQLLLLTQHFPRHIVRCYTMTRAPCHVSCDVTRVRYSDQRTLLPHHHGGERGARPARVA